MLRSGDIVVLLAAGESEPGWSLRAMAERLGVQHSKVQRAVDRLAAARLYDRDRGQAIPHATEEFLLHGLKYAFPVRLGGPARGVPTGWAVPPLSEEIEDSDPSPVWPAAEGTVRGQSVEPLDPILPVLRASWPAVADMAALLDSLRLGDARVRRLAEQHLTDRLRSTAS